MKENTDNGKFILVPGEDSQIRKSKSAMCTAKRTAVAEEEASDPEQGKRVCVSLLLTMLSHTQTPYQ